MRKRKWIFVAAPVGLALFIAAGGEVVMQLWNWLAPELFGWREITFWQGLGLLALCRILFGGLVGGPRGPRYTARMTGEERELLRQRIRDRCAGEPGDATSNT